MIEDKYMTVNNIRLHYRDLGPEDGAPVLLLHGWPTSSFLWRNVVPEMTKHNRVLLLDLPGFGLSDKSPDIAYTFRFFQKILDGFLENLGIDKVGLGVHDLGGPVGLYWACNNLERVSKLAILNTLVYPEMSWAVKLFIFMTKMPLINSLLVSPMGLRFAIEFGVHDKRKLKPDAREGTAAPFKTDADRRALLKAGGDLNPKGFFLMANRLPKYTGPVRIIYGARDGILPDIAETVDRLKKDLPQSQVTVLPDCGHFLQEEEPEQVGRHLAEFFGA